MKSFKADYVFPVCADPIKNGVVTVDDLGKIISVTDSHPPATKDAPLEHLKGIICPGFINTHCHLELSHLKGKVAQKRGLINFIKDIQATRISDKDVILKAAEKDDSYKWTVLAIVMIGTLMSALDSSIVNVSLPKIMADFGASVDDIEWVVTGYMLSFAVLMPTEAVSLAVPHPPATARH